VEKAFMKYKNQLGLKRLRIHTENGWEKNVCRFYGVNAGFLHTQSNEREKAVPEDGDGKDVYNFVKVEKKQP
jgi:hypothetical protein